MRSHDRAGELAGSVRRPIPGARRMGLADRNETLEVTVLLRRGGSLFPSLVDLGASPVASRRYLTRGEFAARYGARAEDLARVRSFASARGLRVRAEDRTRRTVRLSGRVGDLAPAFGTELYRYIYARGSYRGREGPLILPDELEGRVVGVFGLDNRPQARPPFRPRPAWAAGLPAYTPPEVAGAYDFPGDTSGAGECIGLIELGGGYSASDLDAYFSGLGLPVPSVTVVGVDGASNAPTGAPTGPDGEVALDLEVAGSVAPAARLVAYFAPNTDQGFLDAVLAAVHDDTNRPTVLSVSWGSPEPTWTAQARDAFQSAFQDGAALGVTVAVAAGDQGATDGSADGALEVDFPASAPEAIGCGGTRLTISGGTVSKETTWNELSRGEGATGGGVSEAFPRPSYQSGASVPLAPNGYAGRGVPDVAADADPVTGYQVLVDGQSVVLGGTSAVAPLWAALIARINQALGHSVGFVNPLLYAAPAGTFHDITTGDNGGYAAGVGWDACTGLGSPDGTALLNALGGR